MLRPRLDETVGAAVRAYLAARGGADSPTEELKVTVLVSWTAEEVAAGAGGGGAGSVACHVAPLPPIPSPPVRVEVHATNNALMRSATVVSPSAIVSLEYLQAGGLALLDGTLAPAGAFSSDPTSFAVALEAPHEPSVAIASSVIIRSSGGADSAASAASPPTSSPSPAPSSSSGGGGGGKS